MTFDDYVITVRESAAAHPEWRYGQTAFSVLYMVRPELADEVRATPCDPFFNNQMVADFFRYVAPRWEV